MKCDNCFTKVGSDDVFCPNCGIRLPKEEAPPAAPPQQPAYTPPQDAAQNQMPPQNAQQPNAVPSQDAQQAHVAQNTQQTGYNIPPQNAQPSAIPPQGAQPGQPGHMPPPYAPAPPSSKPKTAVIVLGILGIIGALFMPLIGYACSIPGLVMASKEIRLGQTTSNAGRILNIIGLCLSILMHLINIAILRRGFL